MFAYIHMKDGSKVEVLAEGADSVSELRRWCREHIADTTDIDLVLPWQFAPQSPIYPEEIPTGDFWFCLHRRGSGRWDKTEMAKRDRIRKANLYARVEAKRAGIPFSKVA